MVRRRADEDGDVDKTRRTKALEVAGKAVLDALPLGNSLLFAIETSVTARRRRIGEKFLRDVADAMDAADDEAAASQIATYLHTDAGSEAFERGFRAMMDAMSDAGRECIAVLVARYANHRNAPDRVYKRLAALLSDAILVDLVALRSAVGATVEIMRSAFWSREPVVVSLSADGKAHVSSRNTLRSALESEPIDARGVEDALELLVRHGIGREAEDRGMPTYGDDKVEFTEAMIGTLELLSLCLSVVRV